MAPTLKHPHARPLQISYKLGIIVEVAINFTESSTHQIEHAHFERQLRHLIRRRHRAARPGIQRSAGCKVGTGGCAVTQ